MRYIKPLSILTLGELWEQSPEDLFGNDHPMELEIGSGRGDFLMSWAPANPQTNIVGVERNLPIMRRAANKMRGGGHGNVRLVQADILPLLTDWFPAGSLSAVHVYFPDPWPKNKHAKRRIFNNLNLSLIERALKPQGFFHLRTDHPLYFEEMMGVMDGLPQWSPIEIPETLLEHKTAFELRFEGLGQPIFRRSYQLASAESEQKL